MKEMVTIKEAQSAISVFESSEFGMVRTTIVNGEPMFVGRDVAIALGYAKPSNAIAQHVDFEDTLKQGIPDNQGFTQQTTIINESGVYSLVFGSKLESAKKFKRWVFSEVLPSIRKNGGYISDEATPEQQKFLAENQIIDFIKQGNKKWGFRLQNLIESKDCNPIECMESYQYIYDKLGSKFRASFNDKFVYNFEKVAEDIRLKPGKKNGELYCSIIKDRDTLLLAIEKNDHNFDNRSNGQNNRRSKCCKCK